MKNNLENPMTVNRANEVAREVGYALGRIDPVFHQPVVIQHIATAIQSEVDAAVRAERDRMKKSMALWRATAGALHDQILDRELDHIGECNKMVERSNEALRLSKLESEK